VTAALHPAAGHELLDAPDADPALVRRALRDIARANHWLGGRRALRHGLEAVLPREDRPPQCTLLDVGTGAGDLPRAATRWGARRGIVIRAVGVDRHRAAAAMANAGRVPTAQGCGTMLPFRDAHPASYGVDVVLLSQFLHHLDDASAVRVLAEAQRVARRGVIVADLLPSRAAALAFRLFGRALGMHPVTIADGVRSLARSRPPEALLTLARAAGAPAARAWRSPVARVTIAWRTDR
jgi:SAM-dependent methyltransferase